MPHFCFVNDIQCVGICKLVCHQLGKELVRGHKVGRGTTHLGIVLLEGGCKVCQEGRRHAQSADIPKDGDSAQNSTIHGSTDGRQESVGARHVQSRDRCARRCRPLAIQLGENVRVTSGAVRTSMERRQVRNIRQRGAEGPVLDLTLNLRHRFIENIKKVSCQLILELFVVFSALVESRATPFRKPLSLAIGYQNTIGDSRQAFGPCGILGAGETNVNGRRAFFDRIGIVLVEGFIDVIAIEIPQIVGW